MLKHADEMGVDCPKDWVCNICGKAFFQVIFVYKMVVVIYTKHEMILSCLGITFVVFADCRK